MYLIIYHKNIFAGDFYWSLIVIKMKTNEWGRKKGSLNIRHRLGGWLQRHRDLKGITFEHQADQVRYPCLCLHITNMETAAVAGECCWSCNMFAHRLFFPLRPQLCGILVTFRKETPYCSNKRVRSFSLEFLLSYSRHRSRLNPPNFDKFSSCQGTLTAFSLMA